MNNYIIPVAGLIAVLLAHMFFYARTYRGDSGFTGLLKKEEDLLMDSMVVIGGIQATYFLWRAMSVFSTNSANMTSFIDTIGFVLLGIFAFASYRMMSNGREIMEKYSVETHWGEEK